VQGARKDAGLDVSDRIALTLDGDPLALEAARAHEGYLAGEVLATTVAYGNGNGTPARVEGRDLTIGVERSPAR
jgi:isoleucyl-tRNA synthetase